MKIAYFINHYPKVSHSFIRREILALEKLGFEVQRIALHGWADELPDEEDRRERLQTRYILKEGLPALIFGTLRVLLTSPLRFLTGLALAMKMAHRSDRPLPYHLVSLAEACRMLPWLRSFGARHVHAHFGTNSAEVAMVAHALGGPNYSFTAHGPEEFDKPLFLGIREKVRRASFVVAISSFARSQLYRWVHHAHWPKVEVVHCGLEEEFHNIAQYALPKEPRLVCVGRLSEEKGQLLLIEAAARLAAKNIPFELVLVGDGDMRGEIQALIEKHNLGQRVRITGWVSGDAVRREILGSRALVQASFAEGLPVVIMEAMALRRPVLSCYIAGIPELVQSGLHGWLYPAGSVDELVSALEECLSSSDESLQRMGEQARVRVLQRHSIDVEASKLAALLEKYSG